MNEASIIKRMYQRSNKEVAKNIAGASAIGGEPARPVSAGKVW